MENKNLIIGIVLSLVVALGGYYILANNAETEPTTIVTTSETTQAARETETDADISTATNNSDRTAVIAAGRYVDYSDKTYSEAKGEKRVLFFHANWCPTCITANSAFERDVEELPDGVVVLKVDYDSESEPKDKYDITYQHTFVQIDADGNQIAKWSGGDVAALGQNIIQ